ncbi:hypothetical protein SARC_00288 [Sphaeroforma arctica JP610]|uniref:Uncharacterized protein n=1 Tax=Sphaeroforma arctica JP610 TaxID=667725 RepID=A0A0L0GFH9_9EUKA|nr:hypothetical protein SARC_00288 [Sphaeroforma arctica JP610]KNC87586.1 hypothetical protein SARC_00288 [Sphaeroforma arctica JP610]|eukprot:XP_014161488.1 hypothetical protein SARC_00288 [Sphaeroforma arctica JP610]
MSLRLMTPYNCPVPTLPRAPGPGGRGPSAPVISVPDLWWGRLGRSGTLGLPRASRGSDESVGRPKLNSSSPLFFIVKKQILSDSDEYNELMNP